MSRITRTSSRAAYIYTDGTLVELFEESRDGVKIGETTDITLGYCTLNIGRYIEEHRKEHVPHGRIVIHQWQEDGFVKLARGGKINASVPSIWNGSENSRKRSLAVQYVELTTKAGLRFHWTDVTSIMSSQFTVQDEPRFAEAVAPDRLHVGFMWGDARIWKITDLRPKPAASAPPAIEAAA